MAIELKKVMSNQCVEREVREESVLFTCLLGTRDLIELAGFTRSTSHITQANFKANHVRWRTWCGWSWSCSTHGMWLTAVEDRYDHVMGSFTPPEFDRERVEFLDYVCAHEILDS